MRILARAGLCFTLIIHYIHGAHQVFGSIAWEKFHVDIDNSAVRYYSINIFLYFILVTQVLLIWSLCLAVQLQ